MREIFTMEIYTSGACHLYIRTPEHRRQECQGHQVTPENPDTTPACTPDQITPQLLQMLANAYYAGYVTAVDDANEAVRRLLLENSAPRKPAAKVSERRDYRRDQ